MKIEDDFATNSIEELKEKAKQFIEEGYLITIEENNTTYDKEQYLLIAYRKSGKRNIIKLLSENE